MALRTSERVKTSKNPLSRAESRGVSASTAQAIPLDLPPLLAPHAKYGRLSLRFEQMPQNSRLSRGRNNGDRSWSVASEEIDNLQYIPSENASEPHSLSIRVVGLEQDGATLAVLDVRVVPVVPVRTVQEDLSANSNVFLLNQQSHEEIERLKALLAARESELDDVRAAQSAELEKHLAAAKVLFAQMLEERRKDWLIEQETHAATQERVSSEHTQKLRETLRRENDDNLMRAEATWKADESSRLAAAKSEWSAQFAANAAEASQHEGLWREQWRHEAEQNLAHAEAKWKTDAASRMAAAELQWQSKSARELKIAEERFAQAEAELARLRANTATMPDPDTLRRVQDELQGAKNELAKRDAALAEAQAIVAKGDGGEGQRLRTDLASARRAIENKDAIIVAADQAFERAQNSWMRESKDTLTRAKEDWEKSSATKLAAADAKTRAQTEKTLAEMEARLRKSDSALERARAQANAAQAAAVESDESASLRSELVALQVTLAEREQELAQARLIVQETELRGPNARITLHSDRIGEGATPAQLQAGLKKSRHMAFDLVLVAILALLVTIFLPQVEAVLPDSWVANIDLATNSIESVFGRATAPIAAATSPASNPSATAAPVVDVHLATLVHSAKLHTGSKVTSAVISTLQHGASVSVLAQQGNWTLVKADNKNGAPQQGWVYNSYLQLDSAKKTTPAQK